MYDQKFLWKVGTLKKAMKSDGTHAYSEGEIAHIMGFALEGDFREKLMEENAKRRADMIEAAKELKEAGLTIAEISCGLKESPYSVRMLLDDNPDKEEKVEIKVPGYGTVIATSMD